MGGSWLLASCNGGGLRSSISGTGHPSPHDGDVEKHSSLEMECVDVFTNYCFYYDGYYYYYYYYYDYDYYDYYDYDYDYYYYY